MPLLARNKQRKESILCAHGGVCTCVWWLCGEYMHGFVSCKWVCGYVYIYICVSVLTKWWIQIYKYKDMYQ